MAQTALCDTGFWIGLFDNSDPHSEDAESIYNLLTEAKYDFIAPWPTLYEFLNSRFFRRPNWVNKFLYVCEKIKITKLSDVNYRETAYYTLFNAPKKCRDLSLTDLVIKGMLLDVNIKISALITFNSPDFSEICQKRKIEIHPEY